jgi:RNA polymerase sigma-70 factor (ECF subfamily)
VTDTIDELFERYHLAVYRYFQRLTGQNDLAQDLTQESFFRLVRQLATGTQVRNGPAYLFQTAHHVLIDYWRAAAAAPPIDGLVDRVSVDPTQRQALVLKEVLATLPERDRETFVLREVDGLGYAEIAAVQGTTLDSVRARLRRARARLRHALGADLDGAIQPPDEEGDP